MQRKSTTLYAKQTRGPQKLHRRVLFCDFISSRAEDARLLGIRMPVEDMFKGSLAHNISRDLKKRGYDTNSKNRQNSCKFNTQQVPLAKPSASSAAVIFARPQGSRPSGVQRDAGGWQPGSKLSSWPTACFCLGRHEIPPLYLERSLQQHERS